MRQAIQRVPDILCTVTAKEIEDGVRGSNNSCPLALALSRDGYVPRVNQELVSLKKGEDGRWETYLMSRATWHQVQEFDAGKRVQRFTAGLFRLPDEAQPKRYLDADGVVVQENT